MLILDKTRTLDLMIARSEQVVVPDTYNAGWTPRPVAEYVPLPQAGREAARLPTPQPAQTSTVHAA